jgi:TnpA family transposase
LVFVGEGVQNGLAVALREVGRLQRTLFALD